MQIICIYRIIKTKETDYEIMTENRHFFESSEC